MHISVIRAEYDQYRASFREVFDEVVTDKETARRLIAMLVNEADDDNNPAGGRLLSVAAIVGIVGALLDKAEQDQLSS